MKTIMAYGMITFVIQLIAGLAALVYGITIVLPEITYHSYVVYVIAPILIAVGEISGDVLAAYYLIIVAAIIASAVWLFLTSWKGYRKELAMKGESRKHSAIFDLCGLMFGVLFLNMIIVIFSGILWDGPTTPTEGADLWELLFLLANASVWEELIVRVLLIGIPLLIVDLLRNSVRAKGIKYLVGGGFGIGIAEVVLILASSALFGFAHLPGWGAWKVFPAAVAGVAFGYMFMRHGLASAIMLHFGFDYLSLPVEVFAGGSDASLVILGMATLTWMAMGAVFFGYYIVRMIEFVTGGKYFEELPRPASPYEAFYRYPYAPGPVQQPPQAHPGYEIRGPLQEAGGGPTIPPGPPGFFVCPTCGYPEASWRDGRFQCLRCGTIV